PVRDCEDAGTRREGKESGVHTIYPKSSPAGVRVYCEVHEGQSWTVFLARHHQSTQENFTRSWQDYKKGFGDPEGEHWLGNENLHTLTGGETRYRLRVEATNLQGEQRYGEWRVFRVAPEDNRYRLTVEQYSSSSTLGDGLNYHNGQSFTTVDRDHDTNPSINCAVHHGGGGWWWRWGWRWGWVCGDVNPTGPLHLSDLHQDPWEVMSWVSFTPGDGRWVKLSSLTMMVIKS
ncbi:fibrinogen C domain-containing protein 1-like, partial [Homarus americanus]|uniref:fibrinogen C domain-containing protein 1-like n=1 Tax=Homarus americanus TaxID=6706 RepID=UPI001C496B5B